MIDPFDAKTPLPSTWTLDALELVQRLHNNADRVAVELNSNQIDHAMSIDEEKGLKRLQALCRGFLIRKNRIGKGVQIGDSPFVPAPLEAVEVGLGLAKVVETDTVVDLGCGDGRVLQIAAQKFRACRVVGVELPRHPPAPCVVAFREMLSELERCDRQAASSIQFLLADFKDDTVAQLLGEASVVWLFLLPKVLRSLSVLLLSTCPVGTRVLSYTFQLKLPEDFPSDSWEPEASMAVGTSSMLNDAIDTKVHLYCISDSLKEAACRFVMNHDIWATHTVD